MIEVRMSVASTDTEVAMSVDAAYSMADTPVYEGPYSFTPSSEAQVISIEGKKAEQNIVISPIPSNYGLIAWNGAVLTVS